MMQADEFFDKVQERLDIENRDEAEQISEAVLETLGECLYRTEREKLASQLPDQIKGYLHKRSTPEPTTPRHTDRYTLQEFYNRVGARSDAGVYEAAKRAKAVVAVLKEAVTPSQLLEVFATLPDDYMDLVTSDTEGPGFPSADLT